MHLLKTTIALFAVTSFATAFDSSTHGESTAHDMYERDLYERELLEQTGIQDRDIAELTNVIQRRAIQHAAHAAAVPKKPVSQGARKSLVSLI
jgi:pantothenate kinase